MTLIIQTPGTTFSASFPWSFVFSFGVTLGGQIYEQFLSECWNKAHNYKTIQCLRSIFIAPNTSLKCTFSQLLQLKAVSFIFCVWTK